MDRLVVDVAEGKTWREQLTHLEREQMVVMRRGAEADEARQAEADEARQRAIDAVAEGRDFLALRSPTPAQTAAQVQRLTALLEVLAEAVLGRADESP
jgi:hypothetical protein